uniref:Uncharacterized protein n=1 Tax=Rhizobium rhizogenes TaxID=359 RepID=A0A7S4ZTG1_RHIRH|nr:hypothetical protein pC5.8b_275 [Rhizobium rhizogenes]
MHPHDQEADSISYAQGASSAITEYLENGFRLRDFEWDRVLTVGTN